MVTIFVAHAKEEKECAEQINQGLEAKGYAVWREPKSLSMQSILYPRTIENSILGSAALILVWSRHAAQSEWVERHVHFAQRLKKRIVPVLLDATDLPNTLISNNVIRSQVSCGDIVAQLPPDFPAPDSSDSLIKLCEQANHEFNRVRKEAIDQAAEMLQRDEHREAVLAILEYLATNDLMMGVRDKAQQVLEADAKRGMPQPPLTRPDESRHIFGVRCQKGHVTYFDKRRVCLDYRTVLRDRVERAGKELDELHLKCGTCGEELVARIDCGGYKSE